MFLIRVSAPCSPINQCQEGSDEGAYQRVESRGVRAVCNVIPIALTAGVGAPVHAQRGGRAEFVPRRGQQPALVHGAVDWCLSGRRYSGVGNGSAGGLAASGQRVGCHQELCGDHRFIFIYSFFLVKVISCSIKSSANPGY